MVIYGNVIYKRLLRLYIYYILMSSKKAINIIVATSTNYGIGYDNKMCWHIPEELKHFKRITTSCDDKKKRNCVIMGKNTWYSLPKRPLVDRINIIISSRDYEKISREIDELDAKDKEIVKIFKNIEESLKYVDEDYITKEMEEYCIETNINSFKYFK